MDANVYQNKSILTAVYPNKGELLGVSYVIHGLTGEAGEVSNKFKKVLRNGEVSLSYAKRHELMDEASDALWYISALFFELGYTLNQAMEYNLDKLAKRKAEGTLKDRKQCTPETCDVCFKDIHPTILGGCVK